MRIRSVVVFLLALVGCEQNTSSAVRIELIDPAGQNAAADVIDGTLTVTVRQGDRILPCGASGCRATIRGGSFDLALPIESFEQLTTIQARIEGGVEPLFGAVPRFAIANEGLETGAVPIRLVMSDARCQPLAVEGISPTASGSPRMPRPMRDAGSALRRNQTWIVGGSDADGESGRVVRFDMVVMETVTLSALEAPIGPSRGLALSDDDSLFVGSTSWVFERAEDRPPVARRIGLHPGASFASALVDVVLEGVAIVGGESTRTVTWLNHQAFPLAPGTSTLVTERAFARAAAVERGVLVVGGHAETEPAGEWLDFGADGIPVPGLPDGLGGFLIPSPSSASALWIGYEARDGSLSQDTAVIRDCPDACSVSPGPFWTRARADAAGAMTEAGVFWLVGGDESVAIDRVLWDGERPLILPGPDLSTDRAGATAFAHASGVVTVVGGQGGRSGLRDDAELCFPEVLDPL